MQLNIDFTPGLTQQFPEWIDLLAAVVYSSPGGITSVANDLDVSPGNLSRMLSRSETDHRYFPAEWVPKLIKSTGDTRPVYWLVERYIEDPNEKRDRAVNELARLLPQLEQLVEGAKR